MKKSSHEPLDVVNLPSRFFLLPIFLILLFPHRASGDETWKEIEDDRIVHECGVALVKLNKPIGYYAERYQDPAWGVKKLMMLMEKQRNRGQDGAGITIVKCNMPSGKEYVHHLRSASSNAVDHLFEQVVADLKEIPSNVDMDEMDWKNHSHFIGEVMLGHLRYATHSGIDLKYCQPFVRPHGMPCRHIALAGNFNMTNTPTLLKQLEHYGIVSTSDSDTQIILDTIAYHLDVEYEQEVYERLSHPSEMIASSIDSVDLTKVLQKAAKNWDGGYLFCGILGNGDVFVCRDPAGIRPGYYVYNENVFAVASEKVALMDTFSLSEEEVFPVQPGTVLILKQNATLLENQFTSPLPKRECTFERIYFSKANDPNIYKERKALGKNVAENVFKEISGDLSHTIFTYVPNSSLAAFQGLIEEIAHLSSQRMLSMIKESLEKGMMSLEEIKQLASFQPRIEYLISKNQRIRTFISSDQIRKTLVAQLYEVTKGIVSPEDTLVLIDDSIVRGITLKDSLVKKLIDLNPKKIIIVSSAPPVFYPDCYGIDMSQLGRFVAFQAAISLLEERKQTAILQQVKNSCLDQKKLPASRIQNAVKEIYEKFSLEEIERKVAELLTPSDTEWNGTIKVIYQSLEGLHQAIPEFNGDWYFSGNYPTPGGFEVLNASYLNWIEGNDSRSY
jgi:amidophosphoribosyltransferase